MEEISDDFDLRSAPVVRLTGQAEDFLARQLFGDHYDEPSLDDEGRAMQEGLDFFRKEIRPKALDEVDQEELAHIKAHVREAVEFSDGSDMAFSEGGEDQYDFSECSGDGQPGELGGFKMKKPRRERVVTLDMIDENKLADEDIKKYLEKAETETQEKADAEFLKLMEQNTRTLVQQERLEDQYAQR